MTLIAAILFSMGMYYSFQPPIIRLHHPEDTNRLSLSTRFTRARDGPKAEEASTQAHAADIELFAACLKAGLGPQKAAAAVASASTQPAWGRTARLLALGIEAERAWSEVAAIPQLSELAHLAGNSGRSGAALFEACQRIASQHREQAKEEATVKAERAGVLIALPMTLCYLPAFFLLGLMPVLLGMGSTFINL